MVLDRLGASGAAIEIGTVEEDGSRASAAFTATLDLGGVGEFDWAGALFLLEDGERGWRVDWSPGARHPALAPGGTLRRKSQWPERAPILGVGDQVPSAA